MLEAAYTALGGALALGSGRPLDSLDRLFAPVLLPTAGEHGAVLRLGPDLPVEIRTQQSMPARLRREIARAAEAAGARFEEKTTSVAVHYRHIPEAGPALERALRALLVDRPELTLMGGKFIWELRGSGVSKGTAVRAFLESPPFAGRTPVFLGDDVTDEDGFAAAEALGGLAFPVGHEPSRARPAAFAAPAAVRAWLSRLPETLAAAAEKAEVACRI